ncbi:hypothetical protein D2Q93_13365 [Alicyclobacillaceae bacterium I2511]|nr:hypothetical protein D2Q93_13365 [Alicyclobacillaceae bacterium I2511]
MTDKLKCSVVIPVVTKDSSQTFSVEELFGHLQSMVGKVRQANPNLVDYHLHDVGLRLEQGELQAVFEFRR